MYRILLLLAGSFLVTPRGVRSEQEENEKENKRYIAISPIEEKIIFLKNRNLFKMRSLKSFAFLPKNPSKAKILVKKNRRLKGLLFGVRGLAMNESEITAEIDDLYKWLKSRFGRW